MLLRFGEYLQEAKGLAAKKETREISAILWPGSAENLKWEAFLHILAGKILASCDA